MLVLYLHSIVHIVLSFRFNTIYIWLVCLISTCSLVLLNHPTNHRTAAGWPHQPRSTWKWGRCSWAYSRTRMCALWHSCSTLGTHTPRGCFSSTPRSRATTGAAPPPPWRTRGVGAPAAPWAWTRSGGRRSWCPWWCTCRQSCVRTNRKEGRRC